MLLKDTHIEQHRRSFILRFFLLSTFWPLRLSAFSNLYFLAVAAHLMISFVLNTVSNKSLFFLCKNTNQTRAKYKSLCAKYKSNRNPQYKFRSWLGEYPSKREPPRRSRNLLAFSTLFLKVSPNATRDSRSEREVVVIDLTLNVLGDLCG